MHSSCWKAKFLLPGKIGCNFQCVSAEMPSCLASSWTESLNCLELGGKKELAGPGPGTCMKFWPIPGELHCRRSGMQKQSLEMRLTSEHLDGVPAEVELDKEFVVGSTHRKL